MKTLFEELEKVGGVQWQAIIMHLKATGLNSWQDLTKSNLMAFRDQLKASLAPNSAKTVAAAFAGFLHRFEDEVTLPKNFGELLRLKGDEVIKTYLTATEVAKFEAVETKTTREEVVKAEFLIACKTGARISDVLQFTPENIQGGFLTYVSDKTNKRSCVPVSKSTIDRIQWLQKNVMEMDHSTRNDIIRRLGKRAGINEVVKLHIHGKDITGPKWQFLSTHYGRISCASIMEELGAPLNDIKLTLGHSTIQMTERYCKRQRANLNEKTMQFFMDNDNDIVESEENKKEGEDN